MTDASCAPRKRLILGATIALAAAAFTLSACGDDNDGSNTTPCNLDTGASDIAGNLAVHYEASTTGNGTLSSITYATEAGPQVVTNPSLPFETDVTLATAHARIQAVGGVSNGTITIQFQANGGEGNVEQEQASCGAD